MSQTMRAVVLDGPGPPEALVIKDIPVPDPAVGWVLIRVRAFGLNRSELHTRLGLAQGVTFPRVPGIEAVGQVAECPGGEFAPGQQVGSDLDWSVLGAVPEMLQTASGSLDVGLDARPGQSILIRGGTSSVGMATAVLAKQRGMTVLSTTRSPAKSTALAGVGADHVLIDDGQVAGRVRRILADGADCALELIGTPTLPDTLRSVRVHGVVCFTGMLSNQWTVRDFYPIDYLPRGVRLAAYGGESADLPPLLLQDFLDRVAAGTAVVPIGHVYRLDQIVEAHAAMEANRVSGKLVVLT
jgi:NADPH2:quinone reductase